MILTSQYNKIQKDKNAIYPLGDYPSKQEHDNLGFARNDSLRTKKDIGAIQTGEFRPPRAGE